MFSKFNKGLALSVSLPNVLAKNISRAVWFCFTWIFFIAELKRAKRASKAPWVSNIGNPSSREKFGYDVSVRASERPSVQTLGEGEGRLE